MTASDTLDRSPLRHSATPHGTAEAAAIKSHSRSASKANGKALLTFAEAGELLGVGERKAHNIVPTLVTPVVLGPRCVRIVRAELEAAVANLPRRTAPTEPAQLLRGKKLALLQRAGHAAAGTPATA